MRIVATSDTHYPPFVRRLDMMLNTVWDPTIPIPDGDVFVHAGDLMRMGYPDEWGPAVEWLARLPHKHKFYVPGNHDFHLQVYPGPALQQLRQAGVTVVGLPGNDQYASVRLPNGMRMLGLPYVTNLPRWAYNTTEETLRAHLLKVWAPGEQDIIVSHMPVKGFLDVADNGLHAGCKAYRAYLDMMKPKVWISGHIHEGYGTVAYNHTRLYNVAMCNRDYKHANAPMIVEV